MIDIGANLGGPAFKDDLPAVLNRAKEQAIAAIIITGTSAQNSIEAHQLSRQHPDFLYSTAGVHPHDADNYDDASEQLICDLLQQNNVVAVGETGLDYNRNFSTPANQRRAFEAQIELAVAYKKPLFLHERDAFDDLHAIMSANKNRYCNAVVHCFTGELNALRAYLDLGLYIGITGWLCDKKRGAHLREIVNYIPLDRLMIETDSPYLTPQIMTINDEAKAEKPTSVKSRLIKKSRNEPWTLSVTADVLAECLAVDRQVLVDQTTQNAERFFKLDYKSKE